MYIELAIFALFAFSYSIVAGRIERAAASGPIVFVVSGFLMGPLVLGWFGPRGLASIVFAIIVVNKDVPGSKFLAMIVGLTVFLSLVAHGVSANPLAKLLGQREGKKTVSA